MKRYHGTWKLNSGKTAEIDGGWRLRFEINPFRQQVQCVSDEVPRFDRRVRFGQIFGNGLSLVVESVVAARFSWSVILPFYNEAEIISCAIASLACQTKPFHLLLVDNGSTDQSACRAIAACRNHGVNFLLISEPRPGKVAALNTGLRLADTTYIATCDADTYYPPNYLERAQGLLEAGEAMAGAWFIPRSAGPLHRAFSRVHIAFATWLFPKQCLTGGAGQAFRREKLVAAGGFDPGHWDLVLEDHEVCHRLAPLGQFRYDPEFWCDPANRVRKRPTTRWGAIERFLYHASATKFGDWFFYRFLKPRLEARQLASVALREVAP